MPSRERAPIALELSGSLLLAGAYAILLPGGAGVALPWPLKVAARVRGSDEATLTTRDRQGTVTIALRGGYPDAPAAVTLDFGEAPAQGTSALAALAWDAWHRGSPDPASAARLHRAWQQGVGSGYDVWTSALGRPLWLETRSDLLSCEPMTVAASASLVVGVGPKGPSTSALVSRFLRRANAHPEAARALGRASFAACQSLAQAMAAPGPGPRITALARVAKLDDHLAPLLGQAWLPPLGPADDACSLGGAAVPAGASADVWIAALGSEQDEQRLVAAWQARGLVATRFRADAKRNP